MAAGYSGTPLVKKLGIKQAHRIRSVGQPPGYAATLGPLPPDVRRLRRASRDVDVVQWFVTKRRELETGFQARKAEIRPDGALWVSWPKKTSSIASDVDGNLVRATGLENGLVDVKVCAVDDDWSALKFVYRLKDG